MFQLYDFNGSVALEDIGCGIVVDLWPVLMAMNDNHAIRFLGKELIGTRPCLGVSSLNHLDERFLRGV